MSANIINVVLFSVLVLQRKWANLSLAQEIEVNRCDDRSVPYISRIVLVADFIVKKKYVSEIS